MTDCDDIPTVDAEDFDPSERDWLFGDPAMLEVDGEPVGTLSSVDIDADDLRESLSQPWFGRIASAAAGADPDPVYGDSLALSDAAETVAEYQDLLAQQTADLTLDAVSRVAEAHAERLEYELRGAWRAGYDYVHVYDDMGMTPLGRDDPAERFALRQYILPAHGSDPRPDPPGMVYRYSYDLTSVPDDVLRRAIRGEIDTDELLEVSDE